MLVRRLARPLLASVFVTGGIDTLRNPKPRAEVAGPLVDRMATAAQPVAQKLAGAVEGHVDQVAAAVDAGAERVADAVPDAAGGERVATAAEQATTASADAAQVVHDVARGQALPFETETYVKVSAAVQVGAGLLLATGKFPRAASVALAATLVPTTIAGHPFWELEGDERRTQRTQFLKNAGLLGGLILAAVDTEGRPGVAYRARHARDEAKAAAAAAGLSAALADLGRAASSHGHDLVAAARDSELPDTARAKAHDLVATARESDLPKVAAARARELAAEASARADDLSSSAQALGERVAGSVRAA